MPEQSLPLFQLPRPSLKHLFLPKAPQRIDFKGRGRGKIEIREVERRDHAMLLNRQLSGVSQYADRIQKSVLEHTLPEMEGIPIQLTTAPGLSLVSSL